MTNHDATATDQIQLTSGSKPATTDSQFTRREVLAGMAAGAAMALPTIVPARVLGRDGAVAPSEKINLGVIGIGPRCTYVLTSMLGLPDVRCVAITDVQKSRRDAGKALVDKLAGNSDCVLYRDMREMLARKDIDAVIVATGDRWHTHASILAAEAGKDVYCEKPCGLTIKNVQDLAATMKRTGRIFQAGTQRRSVPQFQTAVEMAQSGKLGKLDTLHASVYMPELATRGCPASRLRRPRCATGISGSVSLPGGLTTQPTSRASGAVSTTLNRGHVCWTGVLTPSTNASGPTAPTARRRSNSSRVRSVSPADMQTA